MSENYIVINGKKAELTEEQLKALGIEVKKANPFKRVNRTYPFYFISNKGKVEYGVEVKDFHCEGLFNAANYCTDKAIMEQRALHETLNRLLWRYSMEHKGEHKKSWDGRDMFHVIMHWEKNDEEFGICALSNAFGLEPRFDTKEIARNAIKEIIEPFMKEHPEFKW